MKLMQICFLKFSIFKYLETDRFKVYNFYKEDILVSRSNKIYEIMHAYMSSLILIRWISTSTGNIELLIKEMDKLK